MIQKASKTNRQSGQAALIVTFASVFLFGLLGVVVDTGYGYFVKQVAQAAVDSAAMAGAGMAQSSGGTCGDAVLCQSDTACAVNPTSPPVTNFDAACLYASKNGFPTTATQRVTLSAGTGKPPSNSGVTASYWITATATRTFPLSFTRILGFETATVSAQATSGLVPSYSAGGCICRNTQ